MIPQPPASWSETHQYHAPNVSPDQLSERQVADYILYVRDELAVAKGTFQPMFFGLKFSYVQTLGYEWPLFTKEKSASHTTYNCPTSAATTIVAA